MMLNAAMWSTSDVYAMLLNQGLTKPVVAGLKSVNDRHARSTRYYSSLYINHDETGQNILPHALVNRVLVN